MNKEEYNQLLVKYYEGETTAKEEQTLHNYLKKSDADDAFDKNWFEYLNVARNEDHIHLNGEDLLENAISLHERQMKVTRKKHFLFYTLTGVAAGLAILIGIFFYPLINKETNELTHTEQYKIENPEIAYLEAKKALIKVSEGLNKGTNQLAKMDKLNEEARKLDRVMLFNVGVVQLTKFQHIEEQN